MVELRGIAWGHTRATAPLLVTAQAWSDLHRELSIVWEKRSLWAFGEASLRELIERYDLLVIDHPMVGAAAEHGFLVPLDLHVASGWLDEQERLSVGASHRTYRYAGHQWAAAIDAACQVSAQRPDLLAQEELEVPTTWDEVIELARRTRRVAIPLKAIDTYSSFLTLAANQGEPPLRVGEDRAVERDLGLRVLEQLLELVSLVDRSCFEMNPIDVLTRMSTRDEILYVPYTFGYSNYAREGYAPRRLVFGEIPAAAERSCAGATLGGAGLAVSSRCRHLDEAVAYLQWVADAECQRTTYVLAGGQPGNVAAWDDELANRVTGDFFRHTRDTIEAAFVRPTDPGIEEFQTPAGSALHAALTGELRPEAALDRVDELFRRFLPGR